MRTFLAWTVGIGALIAINLLLSIAASALNVPSSIDYPEPITVNYGWGTDDVEKDSGLTNAGFGIAGIAIWAAFWSGYSVASGKWIVRPERKIHFTNLAMLLGFGAFTIFTIITWNIFIHFNAVWGGILRNLFDLGFAFVLYKLLNNWTQRRIMLLDQAERRDN